MDKAGPTSVETAVIEPVPADQTVQDDGTSPEAAKTEAAKPNVQNRKRRYPGQKVIRTVAKRQRVAKARRVREVRARAVPASAEQNAGYSQSAYQFTSAVQTTPVRVRRAARNSAARSATQ